MDFLQTSNIKLIVCKISESCRLSRNNVLANIEQRYLEISAEEMCKLDLQKKKELCEEMLRGIGKSGIKRKKNLYYLNWI